MELVELLTGRRWDQRSASIREVTLRRRLLWSKGHRKGRWRVSGRRMLATLN